MSSPRLVEISRPAWRDPSTGWEISSGEACPFGSQWHAATHTLVSGDIRGATCANHLPDARRDHARALRIVARMT